MKIVPLGDIVSIRTGKLDANAASDNGPYPFFTCAKEPLKIDRWKYDCEAILVAGNGDLNVKHYKGKFEAYQRTYILSVTEAEKAHTRYLYYFLDTYLERLREQSIGGIIKYIKLDMLRDALVPLPPLPEQRRIAAILDQADALRAKRREALAKLDEMAQAIFVEMFGDPIQNQRKWPKVTLSEVLSRIESGWSPTCLDRPVQEGEWGVLKLSAVTKCTFDQAQNKALPPEVSPRHELEVRAGDLLFTRKNTRDLVAACALVKSTPPHLMIPDLIFRLRLKRETRLNAAFLQRLLVQPSQRAAVQSLAGGSAGSMPNISKSKLSELEVIAPPTELQDSFSERVGAIEQEKEKMLDSFMDLDSLFSSLQHRAFSGTL